MIRTYLLFLAALALTLGGAACNDSAERPSANAPKGSSNGGDEGSCVFFAH